MTAEDFTARLNREILVLDGAMGTMIMRALSSAPRNASLQVSGVCYDELVLTEPDLIREIHTAYLDAGVDIISTNTFNANRLSLADYQLTHKVKDICRKGAELAREAVDDYCLKNGISTEKTPIVAGIMGPTSVSLSKCKGECFDIMADAYAEQAQGLIEGGVDLLLLETVFDLRNAEAAVAGIEREYKETDERLPLIISATLNEDGRLYSGNTLEQFADRFSRTGAVALGLNCGCGVREMVQQIERLADTYKGFIAIYPNAGIPDVLGNYHDTPEIMATALKPLLEKGLINIVGGCCGTNPEHIRLMADIAKKYPPREVSNNIKVNIKS